jgi:hypothetical protein
MGFSIHYRSTETMHPALAFEIKQHAERLIGQYAWLSCEPISLQQQSDGYLEGQSKPSFFPAEADAHEADLEGLPDGTVLTLAEVLCSLSREHGIDWQLGHDYEPDWIGRICNGVADVELIEQLETFGSIGDLLDEALDEFDDNDLEEGDFQWKSGEIDFFDDSKLSEDGEDEDLDDTGPRVLKFPGSE